MIHVVDDDEAMRAAVARLLRSEGHEVRLHASAGDFLIAVPELQGGCILLDLEMPGPSGLELQQALQRQAVPMPIVFLTGTGDIASSVRAMKSGAVDFLTKPVEPVHLLRAVRAALDRDRAARDAQASLALVEARHALLTARERSVLERVVAGASNKQIGRELGITERTVKAHRGQVMSKMQATSVAQLVQLASVLRGQHQI